MAEKKVKKKTKATAKTKAKARAPTKPKPKPKERWERLPNESAIAFSAFAIYRDLGVTRSIEKALAKDNENRAKKGLKQSDRLSSFKDWSAKYDWPDRSLAYDDDTAAKALAKAQAKRVKRQADLAAQLFDIELDAQELKLQPARGLIEYANGKTPQQVQQKDYTYEAAVKVGTSKDGKAVTEKIVARPSKTVTVTQKPHLLALRAGPVVDKVLENLRRIAGVDEVNPYSDNLEPVREFDFTALTIEEQALAFKLMLKAKPEESEENTAPALPAGH